MNTTTAGDRSGTVNDRPRARQLRRSGEDREDESLTQARIAVRRDPSR